jgi:hypothetical protein
VLGSAARALGLLSEVESGSAEAVRSAAEISLSSKHMTFRRWSLDERRANVNLVFSFNHEIILTSNNPPHNFADYMHTSLDWYGGTSD